MAAAEMPEKIQAKRKNSGQTMYTSIAIPSTQHPDNVIEQAANGTEGVEGYFRHNRRSAITRSTPIAGSQRSPHWLWL
ncbi:MAG: hypothetical protein QOD29_5000 [Alphaproteobacteria bacterium]|nr:hypothetical protein [Alphaproteobacteria bacterium]